MFSLAIRTFALLSVMNLAFPAMTLANGPQPSLALFGRDCGGTSKTQSTIVTPSLAGGVETPAEGAGLHLATDWRFLLSDFNQTDVANRSDSGATAPGWRANVQANRERVAAIQDAPSLAVDGAGTVYGAWQDYRTAEPGADPDIFVGHSSDGGVSWNPSVRVNNDTENASQFSPSAAAGAAGAVYVAWHDFRNGDSDIYTSRSLNGGRDWSPNIRINDDSGDADQFQPSLVRAKSGVLYAAWEDHRNGNPDIYVARFDVRSRRWTENIKVNNTRDSSSQINPSLSVGPAGELLVAWQDNRGGEAEIYVAWSTTGGASWRGNIPVHHEGDAAQEGPSLDLDDDGFAFVAWLSGGDIFAARSRNGGREWGAPIRLDTGAAAAPPVLVAGADREVVAVWCATQSGFDTIMAAHSSTRGAGWRGAIPVSDTRPGLRMNPALAVNKTGRVFAAWRDDRGTSDGPRANIWTSSWPDSEGAVTTAAPSADNSSVSW